MPEDTAGGSPVATGDIKWYSAALRFLIPSMSGDCSVISITLLATSGKEAVDQAGEIFTNLLFDPGSGKHYLPDGPEVEPWLIDVFEIPDPYATRLNDEWNRLTGASLAEGYASGATIKKNVIELFPSRRSPDDSKDGGGGSSTPPKNDPSPG